MRNTNPLRNVNFATGVISANTESSSLSASCLAHSVYESTRL